MLKHIAMIAARWPPPPGAVEATADCMKVALWTYRPCPVAREPSGSRHASSGGLAGRPVGRLDEAPHDGAGNDADVMMGMMSIRKSTGR
jgi:hypothetical protein